jgi:hypothetical protein
MLQRSRVCVTWIALRAAFVGVPVGLLGGCDSSPGGSPQMVRELPPAPPGEMNSDDFIKQKAKTKAKKR